MDQFLKFLEELKFSGTYALAAHLVGLTYTDFRDRSFNCYVWKDTISGSSTATYFLETPNSLKTNPENDFGNNSICLCHWSLFLK